MKKIKNKWITKNSQTRLYQIPVPIVGLTGGIASGKSTVAQMFRDADCAVIDADQLVKKIYAQKESLEFVSFHFPEAFKKNAIDFKTLRSLLFSNLENQNKIEAFIYAQLPLAFIKSYHELKNPAFVVYDVPLLFEKKLHLLVDVSVCVFAPEAMQYTRLMSRDHISKTLAEKILATQINIEEKKKQADMVIENKEDLASLKKNFENFLTLLLD